MKAQAPDPQTASNFIHFFTLVLIAVALIITGVSCFLLYSVMPSTVFNNCAVQGNITPLNATMLVCYNCSLEKENANFEGNFSPVQVYDNITILNVTPVSIENCSAGNTTLLKKFGQIFNQFSVSGVFKSYFTDGGLLNLIINNFTIFISILGAISLYCYFYYNITFNANVISEYPESQQQNLKIFLQILFPTLILLAFYVISYYYFNLRISALEWILIILFLALSLLTSGIFYSYSKEIRPFFDNLFQFAEARNFSTRILGAEIFDGLVYINSVLAFIFPFILISYGIISDFNILSMVFIVALDLVMIWQINIVNNGPRRIFDLKIRDNEKIYRGFLFTRLEKEVVQILVDDNHLKNKIIEVPRTSIEYAKLNEDTWKTRVNPPQTYYQAILLVLESFGILMNFFKTLAGFLIGLLGGLFLWWLLLIVSTKFEPPIEILIVILLPIALVFGFYYGRTFRPFRIMRSEEWRRYDSSFEKEWKDQEE